MLRLSSFLIAAMVAGGSVLAFAGDASAQRPGGNRPSGARPAAARPQAQQARPQAQQARPQAQQARPQQVQQFRPQPQQYRSQYHRDYDYRDYDRRGTSFGIGGIGISIGTSPRYDYQRSYYSPGGGPIYVERYVEPSVTVYPAQSEPAPVYVEPSERRAETYIRVILPDPEGTVWMDDRQSTLSGESRLFGFPDEGANRAYVHKVKATFNRDGKMVTEEREVRVTGNTTAVADFTRPIDPESDVPLTPPEENP